MFNYILYIPSFLGCLHKRRLGKLGIYLFMSRHLYGFSIQYTLNIQFRILPKKFFYVFYDSRLTNPNELKTDPIYNLIRLGLTFESDLWDFTNITFYGSL